MESKDITRCMILLVLSLCGMLILYAGTASAACNEQALVVKVNLSPAQAKYLVGTALNYQVVLDNTHSGTNTACDATLSTNATLTLPDGTTKTLQSNGVTIAADQIITCPGSAGCDAGPYSYTIASANGRTFPSGCPPSSSPDTTLPFYVIAYTAGTANTDLGAIDLCKSIAVNVVECIVDSDCTDDNNPCTVKACVSNACVQNPGNAGVVCRASAGVCDVAETCTGSSADCPADAFLSAATVCRASAGVCDVAETCTGSSAACPADAFLSAATVCRASAGVCDVAETCTGSSAACPADSFLPATTVCRASAGVCDVAETCTGSSAACPADSFLPATTVCRPAVGECDQTEYCDGTHAACPADLKRPSSTPCTDADNIACTTAGCDGAGNCDQKHIDNCQVVGCRITAGGIAPTLGTNPKKPADVLTAHFGGQVGAPCGCIGCFDDFGNIQGNWEHQRSKSTRYNNFHAKDYNSLICGCQTCTDTEAGVVSNVLDGKLCNPDDRVCGPEPPRAPANVACFSGIGWVNDTKGKRDVPAAFRVEVEDHSEPGAGKTPPDDVYRIRIWVAASIDDAKSMASQVCCTNSDPLNIGLPDIDDGGTIINGNIQIHPETPNTVKGICPPPELSCQTQ